MKCLDCSTEMTNYEIHTLTGKVSYNVCESCGGLWLDRGELDKMAYQVDGDIEYCSKDRARGTAPIHRCPRCPGMQLQKVMFLGDDAFILQRCDNCNGFWLDGGQLEKIDEKLAKIMRVKGEGFSAFITNVHLPHYYKRIKRDSAETDFSEPVLPVRHAKLLSKTPHKCPTCENALDSYGAYGIKIENCSECGGLWLHPRELKALKAKVDAGSWGNLRWMNDEVDALEKASAMVSDKRCPECRDSRLVSTRFGNSKIIVDWCEQCRGIWLQCDEFEEICRYLRDELDRLTPKDMEKKVAEEVKRIWTDGSEGKMAEILDAKAAISALLNISIFEHPRVAKLLAAAAAGGRILAG